MPYKVIAAALLILVLHGCKKVEEASCPKCTADSACVTEFRYYTVRVTDPGGRPVPLDRFETVELSDGKPLDRQTTDAELRLGNTTGFYPLIDDRNKDELSTCKKEYEFRGYSRNEQLVSRRFFLRDDCCHVELVSGDQYIVFP